MLYYFMHSAGKANRYNSKTINTARHKIKQQNKKKGIFVHLQTVAWKVFPRIMKKSSKVSFCFLCKNGKQNLQVWRGSMTVEAALVVPLLLFAIWNLISILEIYRLQSNLSYALHATAKDMAVYAHTYEKVTGDEDSFVESIGLTYLYAQGQVTEKVGKLYLDTSPLKDGADSIGWMRSRILEDDCIDLIATYQVEPAISILGFDDIGMYSRMRTRAWTGYDNAGETIGQAGERLVYITPNGEVYHMKRGCSYLRLSIRAVTKDELATLRNQDREIYDACKACDGASKNTVFITDYGDCYHASLRCMGLRRTIEVVPMSQVGARTKCQKCGG